MNEAVANVVIEPIIEPIVEAKPADVTPETKVNVTPDKYEFTDIEAADPALITAYSDAAKEFGLTGVAAQGILSKVLPMMAEQQAAQHTAMVEGWTNASKADKEFGGDKLDENLAIAQKAMQTLGTPELLSFLNESGLGNHPELIRAFYKAGMKISEDNIVIPGGSVTGFDSAAKKMFPTMN